MIFLALIYLAFISLGLPDSLLGSSWPIMNLDFQVPMGHAGFISMIVSGGTIAASLLAHRLIRRFGTGRITVASVAMTAVALLGFSLSPSFVGLLFCAVPLGLGAGAVDSGLNEFVAEHYEAKHMNWLHCFWGVGAMLGSVLLSLLAKWGYGWKSGYSNIAILQFALVALLLCSLPMWRRYDKPEQPPSRLQDSNAAYGLLTPLRAKGAGFAMLTFFLYSSVESSMILWGASYLVKSQNMLPENAAGWVSLFFLGITGGRMLCGFASMKLCNETLIRMGGVLVIAGLTLMLMPLPVVCTLAAFLLIGLGLAPIFPGMLHQTPVYFAKQDPQAAMGLQMAFAYTGTSLMPPLFGQIFEYTSFGWMPVILLVCSMGLLLCTARLAALNRTAGDTNQSSAKEAPAP